MKLKYMKIYVGTYAKYNAGSISGKWLELDDYSDVNEFYDACRELHSDEEDPEFMFQDMENIPRNMASESHVSPAIWEINDKVPADEQEAFYSYVENFCLEVSDVDAVYEQFRDNYHGKYDNFTSFVEDFLENTGFFCDVPEKFKEYFDFESYGQNEMYNYDIYDGEFIFTN